jgi:hypothetical protein
MDAETKQVLASVCEILKAEINQSVETEKILVSVIKALAERDSEFYQKYSAHMETMNLVSSRGVRDTANDALLRLGRIIQRLKE